MVITADILARALTYPYPVPGDDYLFSAGRSRPLCASFPLAERTAVVAVGSNRAPQQLRRKFGDTAEIPVTQGTLVDYDVVYSAHVARYGSVPACLFPSANTRVEIWVNWLTPEQLAAMHLTEAVGVNYDFVALPQASVSGRGLGSDIAAYYYKSRRGALAVAGQPAALAAVNARQRRYLPRDQESLLRHVHGRYGGGDFTSWILRVIASEQDRLQLTARLSETAIRAENIA